MPEYNPDGTIKRTWPLLMERGNQKVNAYTEVDVVYLEWHGWRTASSPPPAAAAGPFDPSSATVAEVQAYLDGADDAERTRVLEAERAGQARKSLVGE